jgi:hypothetical protein
MCIQSYLYIPKIDHILTDLIMRNETITKPTSSSKDQWFWKIKKDFVIFFQITRALGL